MNPQSQKPVTVLFLGSLTHSDDTNFLDKTKPHEDEIDFQSAVKVSLIRIPRPGKDIYSRHISITQSQPIKSFEIYYRNLQRTNGRYSLLTSNNELLASSTDDILITPKQPIFTDLLLIKGNFTKITLCIYGNLVKDQFTLSQKCPNYLTNAPIEPISHGAIQIKKDIFQQKLNDIRASQSSLENQNSDAKWSEIINEEGINEQQIDSICQQSEKLLAMFTDGKLIQEDMVVEFRTGLEEVSANLAKIFKNKQLGLYYPSIEVSNIQNDLSLSVTELALNSFNLSLSEKVRSLQILKFMLQLEKHAEFFIEKDGVEKLIKIYVEFFKLNTVVLSTYKNLILEVLVSLSHWKKAAFQLTQKIPDSYYFEIFEEFSEVVEKNSEQRERSRQKKTKRSRSDSESQSSDDENKKKKKDKQKKRNRSREKKKGKQSKSKQEMMKKIEQQKSEPKIMSLREEIGEVSFYEILLMQFSREKSIKQLIMIKVVLEQILQTMTKSKVASQRVSLSTSLLKDIKYIFNPAGEVLTNKSLKQLASFYHPFLNSVQSVDVEGCDFISQREKLHHMSKYGINNKTIRLLNRLSLQLAQSQSAQQNVNGNEQRPPYSQQFIIMLSQVVRCNDKMTMYGFSRMLNSFRAGGGNDIVYLKKIEAGMTMISEFIYKGLLQDNGLYTVLNLDQIYAALINITNNLSKDPSAFTKQLKKKIRQLTNYAMAYDLFNRSQGNFKTISDHFLRLFKYQSYEINKINDYKKKEFQTYNEKRLPLSNLNEVANLGSFYQLLPEQPLLEIDVYLKIFTIILQYNKNVWCLFYENKLVSGFVVLFNKLSDTLKFMLQPSIQRQTLLLTTKKSYLMIQNYLSVINRVTKMLVKKQEYESAFNDLIQEDNFEYVEIYQKSLEIYISLFNALHNKSSLLSTIASSMAREVLVSIMELYDKLLQSYELTAHSTRENKLKEFFSIVYIKHFVSLKSRGACLSLISFLIQATETTTLKLFTTFFIQQTAKIEPNVGRSIQGYVPLNNQRSMLQNLILANIFRNDPIIQNNLANLIKNLISKHSQKFPILEKVTSIFQNIFDQIQADLKMIGTTFENKLQVIKLQKMNLLSEILRKLECVLTLKFEQKLLKMLRFVESIKYCSQQTSLYQLRSFKLGMRIKSNLVLFLRKSFCQKPQHPQSLSFIQLLSRSLDISQRLSKSIQQRQLQNLSNSQIQLEISSLQLVNSCMQVICGLSVNPYSQSVLLYEVFLEKPYKPVPQISLISIFSKLTSREFVDLLTINQSKYMQIQQEGRKQHYTNSQQIKSLIKNILIRVIYLLCLLTTIDSVEFYSTESRRAAITCLITEDKDFPFSKIQPFKYILPQQLLQTLRDYFSYPIVEKPLTLKSYEKKQTLKNKGYLYSKAIFTIVMEGDLAAKARYQYIAGPWKGGDVSTNLLYTPTRERQYSKLLDKSLALGQSQKLTLNHYEFSQTTTITNSQKAIIESFQLNIKRRTKNIQKKQTVDTQIKLMNIPLVIQYQPPLQKGQLSGMIKKVSPSPSKKGYTKSASQSSYDGRVRISPSPPSHKISGQNIIGFNGVGQPSAQQQYGGQMAQGQITAQDNLSSMNLNPQTTGMISAQTGQQIQMQTGIQGQRWTSPSKQQYPQQQGANLQQKTMQPPQYPNPYYGGSQPMKQPQIGGQIPQTQGTLPYLQMQKAGSHETNGGHMRSGSSSASRSNVPYGGMGNYPQQQQYYPSNPQYQGGGKMYDSRSQSPYQKQYPSQGYQRMNYQQQQQGGSYYQQQDQRQSYGSYGQGGRQGGYQQIPGRSSYQPQYSGYDYQQQSRSQPSSYPPQQQPYSYPNQQEQRLFNQAVLLVTQLRGTLPEHLKNDKKNRLNLILHNNIRIQNRVKEYINSLK